MPKAKQYRGEDIILEQIRDMIEESENNLTWDEACETVAVQFEQQGLASSAQHARSQMVHV